MARKFAEVFEKGLKVIDINEKGMGVAKDHKGAVCFIKKVIPGDVVDIRIYKKRRGYFEAEPTKWIKESKHRTQPICEHFGICGGCKWQHLSYQEQLKFKEKGVLHNLKHIGKMEIKDILPIVETKNPYYYRNKMEFSFSNKRWLTEDEIKEKEIVEKNGLGFHRSGNWDKVVDIKKCYLQAEPSNEIRNAIRSYALENQLAFFDTREQNGFLRTLMIRNTLGGDVMVLIQFFKENTKHRIALLDFLISKFPQIVSLLYCINSKLNDSLYDQEIYCYSGQGFITESINDLRFRINAKSFYQTNPKQAKVLYAITNDFASLKSHETAYDLYTGIGTIALILSNSCKKVVGIESISEAIESAKENANLNKIKNAFFEVGDMKEVFDDAFIKRHGKADVVITDPPRNGMHVNVVKQLLKLSPKRIVYVSCNSATQARDLSLLKVKYELVKSQAVDMFPQTHHVENVVLLQLRTIHE